MLCIEDYALHQASGCIGKVLGYGHQMLNHVYVPTLKVKVLQGQGIDLQSSPKRGSVFEDVSSAWVKLEKRQVPDSIEHLV